LVLDAPTAEADVVLASMGGQPTRPEVRLAEKKRRQQNGDGEQGGSSSGFSEGNDGMRSRDGFKDDEEKELERSEEQRVKEEGVKPFTAAQDSRA